jgi:hypothetical protein
MQDSGLFEFCSHTHNHVYLAQITPEEAEEEMINSKKWLLDRNLCDDVIVYPYGDVNTQVRNIAKKYFRAGIMNDVGNHKINTPPFKSYNIERVYVDFGVDLAKQKIDEAIANNSWVIFGMHCHYETWSADDIRAIVSYIREKGVEIVSVTEGLNLMGNIVEIGDSYYPNTPGTFIVDCEGKSYGTDAPQTIYREIGNITASSTPAAFQIGKTTIITIPNDNVDRGFPTYAYGTLITNVYGTSLDFAYTNQELKIHDTNYKYVRYWKKTEAAWSNFRRINDSYFYSNNVISASTPLSQFDVGISFAYMNDAGGSGLPDNKGGIIMTFNSGAGGWSYQLHKQYNTSNLYIRTSNTDGSWGSFINLTPVNTHKIASTNAYDFNTPITNFPANQITTNIINSQSSTGFPNNSPGTLTTYRISDAWGRQEYRVYQSNAIYGRYVNSSNAWSDFEKISAV